MCAGGQDIPVTLRVAGGVEGGKWKSEEDVRATPPIEEEVETTETTEVTEPVEPSAPLYQPVIDRINKLSEKLPDKVADETVEEMQPMMHHGWGMNDRNHHHTMRMLDRIMRNTSRRPRPPRPGRNGKWGGVAVDPKVHPGLAERSDPIRHTSRGLLGANQQVAGLAGLFGGLQQPKNRKNYTDHFNTPMQFPQQQMATPMQPEVMEQQQMEILGQAKQFAGGGIVNALMATPIGQAAIRQYATGGEVGEDVEAKQVLEHTPTGATIEDILAGRATFFNPFKYRQGEVISDISDTLGIAPIKKKRTPTIEYQDSEGGTPPTDDGGYGDFTQYSGGHRGGEFAIDPHTPIADMVRGVTSGLVRLAAPLGTGMLMGPANRLDEKEPAYDPNFGTGKGTVEAPDFEKTSPGGWRGAQNQPEFNPIIGLTAEPTLADPSKLGLISTPPGIDAVWQGDADALPALTTPLTAASLHPGRVNDPQAVDPGQGGTFTPGQAVQNAAQTLASAGQPEHMVTHPGIATPTTTSKGSPTQVVAAELIAANPAHYSHILGIDPPSIHHSQTTPTPTPTGRGALSQLTTQMNDPDIGMRDIDPRSGYKGTINDPEREDRKQATTGVGSQTLSGGLPGGQTSIDPMTFDPSLFSGLGSLLGPGSVTEQDIQTQLARNIADSITPPPTRTYKQLMDAQTLQDKDFQDYGTLTGSDFTAAIEDFQQAVADAGIGGPGDDDSPGQEEAGEDALGGIT